MTTEKIVRWGILGTGWIATKFVEDLKLVPGSRIEAVGSRTLASAQQFAAQANISVAYGSYLELANAPNIDIIYVATPHTRHKEDCILCLESGKAVLCEKPFAMNAREAREIIEVARSRQLFCMEAMWMRFLPLALEVRDIINRGEIGEICSLTADFGYPTEFDPNNRFFNLERGGGSLLDRGVYPLSLASFLLGRPSHVSGYAQIGSTGVDEQSVVTLGYDNGAVAILSASLKSYGTNTATIIGTRGKICIGDSFYRPEKISVTRFSDQPIVSSSQEKVFLTSPKQKIKNFIKKNPAVRRIRSLKPGKVINRIHFTRGNGYVCQAKEVVKCLKNGEIESSIMPLDETIEILEVMDKIRQSWNIKYPGE